MKYASKLYFRFWRPAVFILTLAACAYLLLFHNLAHLVPGYDSREMRNLAQYHTLHAIINNPINAPFKLVFYALQKLGHHNVLAARVTAAGFGVIAGLLFYIISRRWWGSYRVAFFASLMFVTSGGFLHVARLGSALILQMSVLLLIATILWYRHTQHRRLAGYLAAAALAVLCYVPGLIWFELLAFILVSRLLLRKLGQLRWPHLIARLAVAIIVLLPLILAVIRSPHILYAVAGLPTHIQFSQVPLNLWHTILSIGVRNSGSAELWLGHAPLLDVIELALLFLGAYVQLQRPRSLKTIFLAGAAIFSILLVSLGGPVSINCLVPIIYLLIGGGIQLLLQQWMTVFPRNPIAKLTGIALVSIVVFFSVFYQLRSYFVAWPHNTATRELFHK